MHAGRPAECARERCLDACGVDRTLPISLRSAVIARGSRHVRELGPGTGRSAGGHLRAPLGATEHSSPCRQNATLQGQQPRASRQCSPNNQRQHSTNVPGSIPRPSRTTFPLPRPTLAARCSPSGNTPRGSSTESLCGTLSISDQFSPRLIHKIKRGRRVVGSRVGHA